ncbi:hypothetical protein [Desulfuromonas sp. TF]|uniref:hypothetical protein n=1 Tax=Desulfuromonas sp. TF TaxID=1232410 RepID=UPI0003F5CF9E|nr:hypothetical protein [Desulfuromonas sp. TF]
MKKELCWIGALSSFWAVIVWTPAIFGWQPMEGFSGLVITFFLGYCSIILVAQVFSALMALRSLAEDLAKSKRSSQRVLFRTEQPSIAPEE